MIYMIVCKCLQFDHNINRCRVSTTMPSVDSSFSLTSKSVSAVCFVMTSLYPVAETSEFVPENTVSNITSNDVVSTTGAGSSNDLLLFGLLANKSTAVIVILSGLVLAGLIFMVCRLLVKTQALYKPSSSTRHESLAATSDIFDREAIFQ